MANQVTPMLTWKSRLFVLVSGSSPLTTGHLFMICPDVTSGPVKLQHVFTAFLGNCSHGAACLALPVDPTQSQAVLWLFITRLETRTKESAGHACEESYCKRLC
jgi:hypothetical protein